MAALAHYGSQVHIDFSRYGLDEPIQAQATQGIQTLLDSITTRSAQTWTVRSCWRRCRTATGCRPS